MLRPLVFIFIILVLKQVEAQDRYFTIEGSIISKQDSLPVPYAHVYLAQTGVGGISDKKGSFTWKLDTAVKMDTIIISYIGFETAFIPVRRPPGGSHIKLQIILETSQTVLSEVKVMPPGSTRTVIMGHKGHGMNDIILSTLPGSEFALKFRLEEFESVYLKKIRCRLSQNTMDSLPVRIRIYDVNSYGDPGLILNRKDIIVYMPQRLGLVEWDVADYNIRIDQDFVVGIQVLSDPEDKIIEIASTTGKVKKIDIESSRLEDADLAIRGTSLATNGYFRDSITGKWFQAKHEKAAVNPCIAIEALVPMND